jgi:penicillin-binding protein 1A
MPTRLLASRHPAPGSTPARRRHGVLPAGALVVVLALLASGCARLPKVDVAALIPAIQSTKIYAADGSLITTLEQEENRESIPIDLIPEHVRNAVIAIEDARFYKHRGFDAKAILRAFWSNARSGTIKEGGSTITQQLVRNAVQEVGKEKTMERKVREASYAYQVEQSFSKDKILELYLNTVYFGEGAYGIQTAAQTYFDKDAKDLSLHEGALLAGLIKSPVNYDPYTDAAAARKRAGLVLDRMVALKLATRADADAAKAAEVVVGGKTDATRYPAPFFVDYITRQVQHSKDFAALGDTVQERSNRLFRGGLRIYTTLDPKVQSAAEEAIAKVLDHPDDPSASAVAVDPKNGHVKAMVGGRDYFADEQSDPCVRVGAINADGSPKTCAKVNLALGRAGGGSGRQSGSAFKPFVLAAALGRGRHLTENFNAAPCIDIPNADAGGTQPWHVCNYEESGFGPMSLREATVKSVNVVYAQLIAKVGAEAVVQTAEQMGIGDTARRLGIDTQLSAVPSAALGANAVSTLDMASAFGAFPTQGVWVKPVSVTQIKDAGGKVVWKPVEEKRQALNRGVAYLTTTVLQEVIERGTAARHGKIGRPAFGKTGTAQEWRDAWFIGGAGTDLVAAVSVFWPDFEIEMKAACSTEVTSYQLVDGKVIPPACRPTRIKVSGGTWPTQIWQLLMLKALEGVPASDFEVPAVDLVEVQIDVSRGCLPNPYTPPDLIRPQRYVAGTEPKEVCAEPSGPAQAFIPSVIGFPESEATKLLAQGGFVVEREEEASRLYPPGRVTRQSPAPGTQAATGETITIWISRTTSEIPVPDVVNLSESQARQILEKAGFQVDVARSQGCARRDQNCFVWDQSPDAGNQIDEGAKVTISVKGSSTATPSPSPSPTRTGNQKG